MVERDDVVQVRVHECRVVRFDLGRGVAKRVARVKVPEDVGLVPCSNGRERALVLAVRCAAETRGQENDERRSRNPDKE